MIDILDSKEAAVAESDRKMEDWALSGMVRCGAIATVRALDANDAAQQVRDGHGIIEVMPSYIIQESFDWDGEIHVAEKLADHTPPVESFQNEERDAGGAEVIPIDEGHET